MLKLLLWVKKEILHVVPVFLFFLFFFTLINWIETFLFLRAGITPFHYIEVAIAAALIAKIVLVVDHLPIIHLFRRQPLIYAIFWKTALYWVLLVLLRLSIRFTPIVYENGFDLRYDWAVLLSRVQWDLFFSIQAFYLMLLFIFVTFQEVTYKIGPEKMRHLFFGKQ